MVVWAHNSHLGDAPATEMGDRGEWNVGQLARQEYGTRAVLVGFTTHTGSVTAASEWDGPAHRKAGSPALPQSYERLFHDVQIPRFLLSLRTNPELASALIIPRLEGAIGVLYLPAVNEEATIFMRGCPDILALSRISTKRARWNRWSEARRGRQGRSPGPSRPACSETRSAKRVTFSRIVNLLNRCRC